MGTLAANAIAPGLLDRYLARTGYAAQQDDRPERKRRPDDQVNLWNPADGADGRDYTAHGSFDDQAKGHSAQLWASHHHGVLAGLAGAVVSAGAALTSSRLKRR
jgi:hypothetical protein